jgi:hypothetical protein
MFFSSWLRNRPTMRRAASAARAPAVRFRPHLESLEERLVPSFTPVTPPAAVGGTPQAVVTADLNGDGRIDVITASQGTVSVLLGDGKGGFAAAKNYATSGISANLSIALGDFNRDGKLDVVVSGSRYGTSVLLGNGDGTFQAALNSAAGMGKYLAVADVNGDGKLDLIGNAGGVAVMLGNGDGTFRAGFTYAMAYASQGVGGAAAVGDFNGDGKVDIVTFTQQSVGLMTGNGDGTFNAPRTIATYSISGYVKAVVVGDFSGDGKLDVGIGFAPSNGGGGLNVSVWTGNGDGTFSNRAGIGTTFYLNTSLPIQLVAADVNHDGHLDLLALASGTGNTHQAALALGGSGGFSGSPSYLPDFGGTATAIATGDFNGDGYLDVAMAGVTSTGVGQVELFLWKP